MTNTYESIFICAGDLPDDKVQAALEKTKSVITRADGKIITAENWGKRKLAYPVEKSREGHYAYLIFSGASETPGLLDRHYQVSDTILRGLTVKVDPRHLETIKPSLKAMSEQVPAENISPAGAPVPPAPPASQGSSAQPAA